LKGKKERHFLQKTMGEYGGGKFSWFTGGFFFFLSFLKIGEWEMENGIWEAPVFII